MIIIAGSMRFAAADRGDVLASLAEVTEASRRDAGCVEYFWSEELDAPGTFRFFECWASQELFEAHLAQPHEADFAERNLGRMTAATATTYEATPAPLPGSGATSHEGAGRVAVQLNHTIVPARDKETSARFLAEILGLDPPTSLGPFLCIETTNGVSLDYMDRAGPFEPGHYAFLVTENEFDAVFARVRARDLTYWADPGHTQAGVLNGHGRGFYFEDPSGHNTEVLTRAYGT